jgi:hypothetical protein
VKNFKKALNVHPLARNGGHLFILSLFNNAVIAERPIDSNKKSIHHEHNKDHLEGSDHDLFIISVFA